MQLRTLLLTGLVLLHVAHSVACQRILVKHDEQYGKAILERAQKLGLSLVGQVPTLLVLEGRARGAAKSTRAQSIIERARSWPGVIAAEQDQPRYMHRPFRFSNTSQSGPGSFQPDCTSRDKPLSNGSWPEYQPYGMDMIQATSSKLPTSTANAGVIVCIIDSGIDSQNPDFVANRLDGCKYEDSYAPAGCPFFWGQDLVGHGSHVAGTIAAQKNGFGVVGVIPGPAEVYIVRVFNDSGDVNQGQGLVYGSTLILAYTQCEGRLAAQQAAFPDKNYRMVVSMSLGAAGPLTIEKMFFREALSRGDVLFVASSGNNGSAPTLTNGKLSSSINPGNYPGAYPEVIAVAAVDCDSNLAPFSQKFPSVDVAAPGVDILSIASQEVAGANSDMAAAFTSDSPRINIAPGMANDGNQVRNSGIGKVTGRIVDCGSGTTKSCPEAKGHICLVQYDPALKQVELGSTLSRSPSDNSSATGRMSGIPKPFSGGGLIPGGLSSAPSRFYCNLMEYCMAQGAKAMLVAAPALSTEFYPTWLSSNTEAVMDVPVLANINCTPYGCDCWARIKDKKLLPTAGLDLRQFSEVKAAVDAAKKSGKAFVGTVDSRVDALQRLSGTSMAVPHVSGGIAKVWAAYPYCNASTIRTAVENTAKDLGPPGRDVMFGYGLLQLEGAFDDLARQPCAKGPKDPLFNGMPNTNLSDLSQSTNSSTVPGSSSNSSSTVAGSRGTTPSNTVRPASASSSNSTTAAATGVLPDIPSSSINKTGQASLAVQAVQQVDRTKQTA